MKFLIVVFWFIIFTRSFLFWLWLWQLKEYHIGRFKAHFEGQKVKKVISSFWRQKFPKFTKKTIIIFLGGLLSEFLIVFYIFSWPDYKFYLSLFLLLIFAPLIFSLLILFFQIPTVIWRSRILEKAKEKRKKFKDLSVIGITGSYGKTSTKEFLATILSQKFKVLKTKQHQNSEVGISQCILNDLKEEHEIFICEMGAYNRGGIKLLCDITKPKIGILTGINEQHMATFGSQENIIKTKFELIESLPERGTAFFNGKNKHCLELYQKTKIKKILYGQESTSAEEENMAGVVAVARELGMNNEEISRGRQKIKPWQSGIQVKKGIGGLNIIDATYSANPTGVIFHLENLKKWQGKKIIVMPCLIELGKASKEVHQRIGKKINEVCDLAIITTKDRFKEIKEGVPNALFMEKPQEILKKIKDFTSEGDVVLLESRVPNQLIKQLII